MTKRTSIRFPNGERVPEGARFQPDRLTLARNRRGMTKTDLSTVSGLSLNILSKYEKGGAEPSEESVWKLAEATGFPPGFFFEESTALVEAEAVSFRSLSRMPARHRDMVTGAASLAISTLDPWIEERFGRPEPSVPDLSGHEPAAASETLRSEWGLGNDPVPDLLALLESKGVRVFSLGFDRAGEGFDSIDALSSWGGSTPYMFLNCGVNPERTRYNLAHELGHLALHRHGQPVGQEAEKEANTFAGHFLLPAAGVRSEANRFMSLDEIIEAKRRWRVSAMAYVYRMHEEGILDSWRYRELCINLRRTYGRDEPSSVGTVETSPTLRRAFGRIDRDVSRAQVASELRIPLEDLQDLIFSHVPTWVDGSGGEAVGRGRASLRLEP